MEEIWNEAVMKFRNIFLERPKKTAKNSVEMFVVRA
jgi:hypothetical protein